MKKPLFLIILLFLTSCAVDPSTDRNDLSAPRVTIQQEVQMGRIVYEQALQQMKEAHPEAYVLYEQARVAEGKGELDTAIEIYHKSMQQAPENGLLLASLGMAYLRKEDIVPARRYLLKAISFDPDYYKPRLGLGYIYLQNRQLEKAVTQLESSLQLLPTVEGTFLLAEAKEAQGDVPKARQLYLTVVKADRNSNLGKVAANRLRELPK